MQKKLFFIFYNRKDDKMFGNNCENNEMYQRIYQKIEQDSKCCKPVAIGPTGSTYT